MDLNVIKGCIRDLDTATGTISEDEYIDTAADYFDVLVGGTRGCLKGGPLIGILGSVFNRAISIAGDEEQAKRAIRRFIHEVLEDIRPGGQSIYDEVRKGLAKELGDDCMP